ncbi:MAG: class I SAM-dependent methyltransferase [Planctomycetota bacterium]
MERCDDCRSLFLAPIPPLEQLGAYYPEDYWIGPTDREEHKPSQGGLLEKYRKFVLRDHVKFVRKVLDGQRARGLPVRVLDVGCGDGSFLEALGEKDCVGMDLSIAALQNTRARGIRAVRSTLTDCSLQPHSFSLVTAFHFLEHVHPVGPVLEQMRKLLVPGGEVVLQVPNANSWQAKLLGRRWAGLDVPRHLVDYSDATFRRTLEEQGFEVVAENQHSLRDNPTAFANSLVPGLYPPARLSRGGKEKGLGAMLANLGYLAVTVACMPFSIVESLFGHGASVMVHARMRG